MKWDEINEINEKKRILFTISNALFHLLVFSFAHFQTVSEQRDTVNHIIYKNPFAHRNSSTFNMHEFIRM